MEILRDLTGGLYTGDQQALNSMTTERIENKIKNAAPNVHAAIQLMVDEGSAANDYIAPIGVNLRVDGAKPNVTFNANGNVMINFGGSDYKLHKHAIGQLSEKLKVPSRYIKELAAGDEWQRLLAAKILNEHSGWTQRSRVLIRSVGGEVRGVLSDHYKRLNSVDIVTAFLTEVEKQGGSLVGGALDETKMWFETIHPQPLIIPTAKNGNVSLAFGARISSSDYGDGALQIRSFIMQGVCLNGMVRESVMRQIHLGSRLPDSLHLSERYYQQETKTQAIAVKELTAHVYSPELVREKALEIQAASEQDVDISRELKNLSRSKISKEESGEIETCLLNSNPDDGVQGAATLWKLVNGVTAVAREKGDRRKRELEEIAGDLIERVKK